MDFSDTSFEQLPLAAKRRTDAVCERFERAWRAGRPRLESFTLPSPPDEQAILFAELLHIELECRRRAGEVPHADDYLARFPQHEDVIRIVFSSPVPAFDSTGSQPPLTVPS